ncbi:hypothetical protein C0J52_02625 [Blattella germanica]|nr:hypothetical protein C0J52_02625 [Blattella germanica]
MGLCNDGDSESTAKLLGLHLDSKLSWKHHSDFVSKKLCKAMFLLRRLKKLIPNDALLNAYYGLFHSHPNYGIMLWGNCASRGKDPNIG